MKTAGIIISIFLMFSTLNLYGNNALEFNGITDYASIPDDDLFDVAAVTIELWFYCDGSGTDVDFLTAKSTEELEIHLGGSISNGIRFIPTTSVWIDTPAEAFTPGSWVYVACVYDPGQSLGKIYVNGNDVGVVNNGSNPLTTAIIHSDSDFRLGLRGNGSFPHNGKMDEVRIWNHARSQVEIQSAFWDPLTGSENGLIAYWRLDVLEDMGINGDGADDIRDYTDNNLHGDTDGTVLTDGVSLHQFTEIAVNLVDVSSGNDVAWGDYDNDGDLDILLSGYSSSPTTKIYKNNGDGTFTEQTGINLTGLVNGSVANTAPNAPEGLAAIADRNSLTFSWNAAADDETPSSGLTYNLRVGSTSGGNEIFSSMAQSDGRRKVPRLGSQNHNTDWTFDVTYPFQTSSAVYYWSVQAIDNCFAGSPFASEQVFNPVLYPCLINADELRPTGTLLWETNSLDVITDYQVQIDDYPDFSSPEVDDNVLPPNSRITELYAGVR